MGIEGIFHANICVSDMERSLKFYRDILGFQVLHDFVIENEALNRALGVEKARVRGVLIRLGDDERATLLDPGSCPGQALVQWLSPGPAGPPYRQLNNLGICRIALKTKDIESVYQDLQAKGVEFMTPPQSVKIEGTPGETKFCCFYDPDRTMPLVDRGAVSRAFSWGPGTGERKSDEPVARLCPTGAEGDHGPVAAVFEAGHGGERDSRARGGEARSGRAGPHRAGSESGP